MVRIVRSSGLPTSTDRDYSDSCALLQAEIDILESQGYQIPPEMMYSSVVSPQAQYHVRQQQQQQHIQSSQRGLGGTTPVRFQPQLRNAHSDPNQQLSSLHNLGQVNLEQAQETGIGPVKWGHQHSDQALQELKNQQQLLQWSVQASQNVSSHLNPFQQRILHQQQLLKALPQQRPQLQQHFQPKDSLIGPVYEQGVCTQRLSQYISQQQNRPNSNSIDFWNKFVAEFFTPNAKKRWCLSLYQNSGKAYGSFIQDTWNCELCNCRPGRGFEVTFEALPRLFKMKYDSGTLEELLSVDMPSRYQNISGYIVLEYAKVTQESVFEQLRVVRDGQLRIVFSPDLKICLWEFCARSHDVLIPRRSIMPEIRKLEATARNYQSCALSACSNESVQELEMSCDAFVKSAGQLEKALQVPSVLTKIGYMQDFGRCLQIADTFCRMRGLIDYSFKTGKGAIESYENLQKRGLGNSAQKPVEKQQNNGPLRSSESNANLSRRSSGTMRTSTSVNAVDGFLRKRLKKSQLEDQMTYTLENPSSGTSSSSNNPLRATRRIVASRAAEVNSPAQTPSSQSDKNESQMYVRKIKQEQVSTPQ